MTRAAGRIGRTFEQLAAAGRKGLVVYLTAGDPDLPRSAELVRAAVRGGADLIELGVPWSDPSADGPVLQAAAERARAAGTTLRGVLEMVRGLRADLDVPIVLFGYYNPVFTYGEQALARDAAAAGADGLLVVDLPPEEAAGLRAACDASALDLVPLLAPTSTPARVAAALGVASGFVYLVSMTGVTGTALGAPEEIARSVGALRAQVPLPVALGFGIATPEDVRRVSPLADAVVVGSAAVRAAAGGPAALEAFVRSLRPDDPPSC